MNALTVPGSTSSTQSLYARMGERERVRCDLIVSVLEAFALEANRDAVAEDYAARIGKSKKRLYAIYYAWKKFGLAGIARSKYTRPPKDDRLPAEFVEEFRRVFESINSNSVPEARRQIVQRLMRGERVPGLGTWRDLWAAKFPRVSPPDSADAWYPRNNIEDILPRGMSDRHLRRHKPTRLEILAAKQGTWAAHQLAPQVLTTRVGLALAQILMADDVWHNVNVVYPASHGRGQLLRPVEVCMYDVLSGHKTCYGMRPRLWNSEEQKHEYIKEHEFRFLLAHQLCNIGFRKEGTILWLERGTAGAGEELRDLLKRISGGAITVKSAPLRDARQLCSIYKGAASGNPHFKAPLEAHHNIAHTVLSSLPGQVGRNRDVQPEELFGRDKAGNQLLNIQAILPPDLAGRIRHSHLLWQDYREIVAVAYDLLADRHWHKLEGWEELKFFAQELAIPGVDRISLDALDAHGSDARQKFEELAELHPEWLRSRRLSPKEVWTRGADQLVRLPPCCLPLILGPKNGVIRPCPETAEISFGQDCGSKLIYPTEYTDENGFRGRMRPGTQYLFHIDQFSATQDLFISDPDGGYIGTSKRITVPCRADDAATLEQIKRTTAEYSRLAAPVARRAAAQLRKEADVVKANTQVIKEAQRRGLLGRPEKESAGVPVAAGVSVGDDADAAIKELYG